jgi:hypothetical protein
MGGALRPSANLVVAPHRAATTKDLPQPVVGLDGTTLARGETARKAIRPQFGASLMSAGINL